MFEEITYEVLLQRMLERVSSKFDKREGSVIWDTHSPTAIELQNVYIELENIIKEAYGSTATRRFLILRCMERGITPYPASKAVLKGEFTPDYVDVIGKRFSIEDLNYVVTEKIEPGIYKVECESYGTVGNRLFGSLVPIEYIPSLATAELTELLIPGEDEEDTEELRQRYFKSFDDKAFGGNMQDYLNKVMSIPGVGAVKVTRVWNSDISPASMIPKDEVTEWFLAYTANPNLDTEVKDWLTNVYTAAIERKLTTGGTVLITILGSDWNPPSQTLIDFVKETMDPDEYTGEGLGLAPIGHVVRVKGAESVNLVIRTRIMYGKSYRWDILKNSIEEVIENYLMELRKKWGDTNRLTVRVSQIESRLLDLDGIEDIGDTVINGVAGNLILGNYEIPVLESVSEL